MTLALIAALGCIAFGLYVGLTIRTVSPSNEAAERVIQRRNQIVVVRGMLIDRDA
jgi:hypothetical protein